MDRPGPARCRAVVERRRSRNRKTVLAGLMSRQCRRRIDGGPAISFLKSRSLPMTRLRFDDLKQYSDVLRSRRGDPITVRFVEPRDAEELQNYFRSLSSRSRYNRFLGAMSELPKPVLDNFTHVSERDGFTVIATVQVD